ncbi:MAG: lysophospholipase [Burkholderiales bacterium]|nr:lysophospholipase [Phycisphaerae bacterium]
MHNFQTTTFYDRTGLLIAIVLIAMMMLPITAAVAQSQPASTAAPLDPAKPTLWLIGDSTVRTGQDTGDNGQWGWGNPIAHYFDRTRINVANRGAGGTSTRTYYRDKWAPVLEAIKPGDFLVMEFGTNDGGQINEPPGPSARARGSIRSNGDETQEIENLLTGKHEIVHSYGWYLRQFIAEAKAKGAVEFYVCSTTARSDWKDGKLGRNTTYNTLSEAAAKQVGAFYIPLNQMACDRFEAIGEEKTKSEYYPDNEKVHPAWLGAILHAECVVDTVKSLEQSKLKNYLLPEAPKGLKNPTGKPR